MELITLFILVNQLRSSDLLLDQSLAESAQLRAEYICEHEFSHDGWVEQFDSLEFDVLLPTLGENLARNFKTEKATVKAWSLSERHNKNIESLKYKYTGFGYADECDVTVQLFSSHPVTGDRADTQLQRSQLYQFMLKTNK